MNKTSVSIIVFGLVIAFGVFLSQNETSTPIKSDQNNLSNITIIDGKQIIDIKAKGGYFPRKSIAKAGIPTVIRFNTSGTFDCSAALRIPSMNISKFLPQNGTTDIDIGIQKAGLFEGTCGMGMYPFEIDFQGL